MASRICVCHRILVCSKKNSYQVGGVFGLGMREFMSCLEDAVLVFSYSSFLLYEGFGKWYGLKGPSAR